MVASEPVSGNSYLGVISGLPSLDRDAHLSQLNLPRVALLRGSSSSLLPRSMRRKRGQQFICCYGCVGVQDTINARGLHAFRIEGGRCILDEGDVETQFHAETRCRLHAGVGVKPTRTIF
jgi:hypothetical protein